MEVTRPFAELLAWIEEARATGLPEPDAMTLATVNAEGRPTARIVSLRRIEPAERPHQLQSLVSRQGEVIDGLEPLRDRLAQARREVGDAPIECPNDWGAFRVHADAIESWVAAPDALHDRIVLVRAGSGWRSERLAPEPPAETAIST